MDIAAQLQSKQAVLWINRVLQGITVLLVLLIGYLAADFLLLFLSPPEPANAPGKIVSTNTSASVTDPSRIPGWNLFGDAGEAKPVQKATQIDVPKTSLKLELLGVIAGKTEEDPNASANIAEKGKSGDVYRIGDKVPGKASLKAIYNDRVILERKGRLETLAFDENYKQPASRKGSRKKSDTSDIKKAAQKIARPRGNMTPNIREILTRDVEGMVSGLGLESSGDGYTVTEGAPAALLSRVGLRRGDVILSVNGNTVGNATEDEILLEQVKASGEAKIEVRRGNQTFTVNYPIK